MDHASAWSRVRTPSPEGSYPIWRGGSTAVPAPAWFPLLLAQHVPSVPRAPRAASRDKAETEVPKVPVAPQPVAPLPVAQDDAAAPLGLLEGSVAVPEPPAPFGTSVGSRGHPEHCGQACKYIWKASGCKDGDACKRCHTCKWTRPRKKGASAVTPETSPADAPKAVKPEGIQLLLAEVVPCSEAPVPIVTLAPQKITLSLMGSV